MSRWIFDLFRGKEDQSNENQDNQIHPKVWQKVNLTNKR